jgi:hypothetical protein
MFLAMCLFEHTAGSCVPAVLTSVMRNDESWGPFGMSRVIPALEADVERGWLLASPFANGLSLSQLNCVWHRLVTLGDRYT